MTSSPPLDWGLGHYEHTAAQLEPVSDLLVATAAPAPGERVVDVGCGTGNAALLAAERGAKVTGVDPAARLLEAARKRAGDRALDAEFMTGDAASIPVADGEAGLVMSVFGVIFAPDPQAAATEMARVAAPDGRIVLSAWLPVGAISKSFRVPREAIARALGTPPPSAPQFAWHDADALRGLLGPHGFEVSLEEHRISFGSSSAREFLQGELENHPVAVAGRAVLEPRGELEEVRNQMLAILEPANEDPDAFRVTSTYVIATAQRS
jgi:SAM-dependent methyltransferase